jgi:GNAT superfamily N-acetyltransferase
MSLSLLPVETQADLLQFIKFPWPIYKGDPYWVPPLIQEMKDRLSPEKNSFWNTAHQKCWIAYQGDRAVGRICAIADQPESPQYNPAIGKFGFFECVDDPQVAKLLFSTAAGWLRSRGFSLMRGPYNPSPNDEIGIQIEGFNIRPVILTGHNPSYYPDLFTRNDFVIFQDLFARLYIRTPGSTFNGSFPEKLQRVAEIAEKRSDITLRNLKPKEWDREIGIACDIYNQALASLPGFNPVPFSEFVQFANSFKPFMDPAMAVIAEIEGKPVGYALALPDVNEALQKVNGKLDLVGTIKFLLALRRLHRVSFKILMMLPEFQGRGIETLLIHKVAKRIWEKGYQEVDMSLAGDENVKSNRFQENLGFKVYLSYRVYGKNIEE